MTKNEELNDETMKELTGMTDQEYNEYCRVLEDCPSIISDWKDLSELEQKKLARHITEWLVNENSQHE